LQPVDEDSAYVPATHRDRRDSLDPSGTDDDPAGEEGGRNRETESSRSDEVGGPDDHLQSAGRGDSSGGAYQQLTLDLFLSEAEQIQKIRSEERRVGKDSSA